MANSEQTNPFKVRSPEKLAAGDAVDLFVDVFSDFYKRLPQQNSWGNFGSESSPSV